MTTAGRTFWISAPTAGSKSTSQISPRLGSSTVAIQIVPAERLEGGQLRILPVVFLGKGGGSLQDRIPLLGGKFPEFGCLPPSLRWHGILGVHRGASKALSCEEVLPTVGPEHPGALPLPPLPLQ